MTGKTNNINLKLLSYFNLAKFKLKTLEIAAVYTILTKQSLILGGLKQYVLISIPAVSYLFIWRVSTLALNVLLQDSCILSGTDPTPKTFTSYEGYLAYKWRRRMYEWNKKFHKEWKNPYFLSPILVFMDHH